MTRQGTAASSLRNGHPKASNFRQAAYQACRAVRDLEQISREVQRYPFDPRSMPSAAWDDLRDCYARLGALLALAPPDGGEQT